MMFTEEYATHHFSFCSYCKPHIKTSFKDGIYLNIKFSGCDTAWYKHTN